MNNKFSIIPIELDDGTVVKIEVIMINPNEDVGLKLIQFNEVSKVIEKISKTVIASLKKVSPQKIKIELGVYIGIESGQLTALLTQGTGNANFKIALEWNESDK